MKQPHITVTEEKKNATCTPTHIFLFLKIVILLSFQIFKHARLILLFKQKTKTPRIVTCVELVEQFIFQIVRI